MKTFPVILLCCFISNFALAGNHPRSALALPGMVTMWVLHKFLGQEDVDSLARQTPSKRKRGGGGSGGYRSDKSGGPKKSSGGGGTGGSGGGGRGGSAGGGAGGGAPGGDCDGEASAEADEHGETMADAIRQLRERWEQRILAALSDIVGVDGERAHAIQLVGNYGAQMINTVEYLVGRLDIHRNRRMFAIIAASQLLLHPELLDFDAETLVGISQGDTSPHYLFGILVGLYRSWGNLHRRDGDAAESPREYAQRRAGEMIARHGAKAEARVSLAGGFGGASASSGVELFWVPEAPAEPLDEADVMEAFRSASYDIGAGAAGASAAEESDAEDADSDGGREESAKRDRKK